MRIPFGLAGRLAFSFIALALLSQWLNYRSASNLRSIAIHQSEMDKIKTVTRVIEPRLKREAEWGHFGITAGSERTLQRHATQGNIPHSDNRRDP